MEYDEALSLKEDYDIWLRHIQKYRKTLRINKYHYARHQTREGGCGTFRTMEREIADSEALMKKWPGMFTYSNAKKGANKMKDNVLNMKARKPLPGV